MLLSWLVIAELILLGLLGLLGLIAIFIGKQDQRDPIYLFCSTFWREFVWPPETMPLDSSRLVPRGAGASGGSAGDDDDGDDDEPSEDDALYGRTRKGSDGRTLRADLGVIVVANAASDEVLGRDSGGLRVQVRGEAGDSQSNKSLIEMVASAIGVKPYQVTLTKGHYQPRKTLNIQGMTNEELQGRLGQLAEAD